LIDSQNSQILTYNLSDGKRSDAAARSIQNSNVVMGSFGGMGSIFMGGFGGGGSTLAADADGAVYLVSGNDILSIDSSGQSETLLTGSSYEIGAPNTNMNAMHCLSDRSIVVNLSGSEANKLYKYMWDENAILDPAKTLTIWSLEDCSLVRGVISAFRKAHSDAEVIYEVALSEDSGATANDAIKNLNTRLLGNDAPDIIILDGCPVSSYASQGLLMDLSQLVDTSRMFENILAPFESNGKLYYIPSQFRFPVLLGQEESLGAIDSLEALTDLVVSGNDRPEFSMTPGAGLSIVDESERPALYFTELEGLFNLIWDSSTAEVVKGSSLDTGALERMLTALKAISDKYKLAEEPEEGRPRMMAMFSRGGGNAVLIPESAIRYSSEQANYGALSVSSLFLLAMQSERPGSAMTAFPGLTADSFIPSVLMGVSVDTNVQDLAVAFIQAMLSYDVQSVSYNTGMPVTKDGFQRQIDTYNEQMIEMDREGSVLDQSIFYVVEELKEPVLPDDVLTTAVWTEAERLCKGETNLESAVKSIEQSIKNYLAERA